MIASISSSTAVQSASMTYERQIQSLDSQVMRLESQIGGLQEKIMDINGNERLSIDEKKEKTSALNEQIGRLRDRISDINVRMSEVQKRKVQAENEARKQQQIAEKSKPIHSGEDDTMIDSNLHHAIIGIDQSPGGFGAAKSQLNSRLREANKEDMFRVKADGKMVMIQRENRRPKNPAEARNVQKRLDDIDSKIVKDRANQLDSLKKPSKNNLQAESTSSTDDELIKNESDNNQRNNSGTGRMEKGQYIKTNA